MKHMNHMPVTDTAFLKHMIPHHQAWRYESKTFITFKKFLYKTVEDIITEQNRKYF